MRKGPYGSKLKPVSNRGIPKGRPPISPGRNVQLSYHTVEINDEEDNLYMQMGQANSDLDVKSKRQQETNSERF